VKKLCLAVVVLSLCSLSLARTLSGANQNNQSATGTSQKNAEIKQASPVNPNDSTSCSFNFSSGANNTFLSYCVSSNGNVLNVVTPIGQQHIFGREGYGVCDINSGTEYFDYGFTGISTNWQPGVVLSQGGNKVKIARTTSDGVWTLTQTIMQVPSSSSIKVTMTMKNNTAISREIQLSRFADIDADGTTANTVDATINDAMIFNSVGRGGSFGLALQNLGTSPFTYLGFVRNTDSAMSPCNPFTNQAIGPLINTDGTAVMTYVITIPAGASKTVNVGYRGL
jgi:hypothetical protein